MRSIDNHTHMKDNFHLNCNSSSGYTLTELLIGMGLMSVILLLVSQYFSGSIKDSEKLMSDAELYKEAQIAQQILAGRIQEAIYVWPSGSHIQLSKAGKTTQNTLLRRKSQSWLVVKQPFLALILPPEQPHYHLARPTGCQRDHLEACYRFFAYFAMRRQDLLKASKGAKPPADEINKDAWVLMQYRANLLAKSGPWYPSYLPNSRALDPEALPNYTLYGGNTAHFLMDYLAPNSLKFAITPPSSGGNNGVVTAHFKLAKLIRQTGPADHHELALDNGEALGGSFAPRGWYGY